MTAELTCCDICGECSDSHLTNWRWYRVQYHRASHQLVTSHACSPECLEVMGRAQSVTPHGEVIPPPREEPNDMPDTGLFWWKRRKEAK